MPQLFVFLYCLNPKSGVIAAQNNLRPLRTSPGLSSFLLFYKATASNWDGTSSPVALRGSDWRAHPAAALVFSWEQQTGVQGWAPRLPNSPVPSQLCRAGAAAAGGRQDTAQRTEPTKLRVFGDAGTTSRGRSGGKAAASSLLGSEAGRVHRCAELCRPLLCSWGCPRVPLPWAGCPPALGWLSPRRLSRR